MVGSADADVLDGLAGVAVLDDEVGLAVYGERRDLAQFRGVIERAGNDAFVKEERLVLQLEE